MGPSRFARVAHRCEGCGGIGGCRYVPACAIDPPSDSYIAMGDEGGSNGGESSRTWWDERGRLRGRQDELMVGEEVPRA